MEQGIAKSLETAGFAVHEVEIAVLDRVVRVEGTVKSDVELERMKKLVELLARDHEVRCDLAVSESPLKSAELIGDALQEGGLAGQDVDIRYERGKVTLYGRVATSQLKDDAARITATIPGVRRIDNQLKIVEPGPDATKLPANRTSENVIELTSSVLAPPRSKVPSNSADAEITYRLVDGKAILTGRAASEEQKRKAEAFARFLLDNPTDVENRIKVIGSEKPVAANKEWYKDFEKAEAEARRLGLPLVIQFHASWCGPCQTMEAVLKDPDVQEQLGKSCIGVKVDIDAERALAARFHISSIPATIVVDPERRILSTSIGVTHKRDFVKQLTRDTSGTDKPRVKVVSGTEDEPAAPKEEIEANEEPETSIDALRHQKVAIADLALEDATIESALRQILEALAPPVQDIDTGVPVRLTCMFDLDYLVLDDSVLVTTKLAANLRKETRVYRLPVLPNCPPDQVAKVISQSVRPWSWRSQVTDIAQQFVTQWPKSAKLPIQLDVQQGLKLASGDANAEGSAPSAESLTADGLAALGPMLSAGGVVMVQAGMAALEIMHHGDPPTGVIQTLPGMLIITQSQSAHREIAELIEQLTEAAASPAPAAVPSY